MSKPLYQQLNEARTQGEWEYDFTHRTNNGSPQDNYIYNPMFTVEFGDGAKARANAQYTALAVNNLHHLAEALEKLLKANQNGEAQGSNWINAHQALSRIS